MTERTKWQGMWTIARFNWPFYVAALLVLVAASWGLGMEGGEMWQWTCISAVVAALYFLVGSLGVSHQVYDRSDLYRWKWLERALAGADRTAMIFCHSGFDEASEALQQRIPQAKWRVLDHYDPALMTETSIRRARQQFPPTAITEVAAFNRWPVAAETVTVIFGLLAIHELRSEQERSQWFAEAERCLLPSGRVVLVEHTRDLANFLTFGPGFLHFHSAASWRRCWERAHLQAADEFRMTPWLRVFILKK